MPRREVRVGESTLEVCGLEELVKLLPNLLVSNDSVAGSSVRHPSLGSSGGLESEGSAMEGCLRRNQSLRGYQ